MLFSSKKLSSRLQFKLGETTATLDGQLLEFAKITHLFKIELRQSTNGVYGYDEFKLVLLFENKPSTILVELIGSRDNWHVQSAAASLSACCRLL